MIDLEKLKAVLAGYKTYFPSHWQDEKYKWEAVKQFQSNWNPDAENFGEMFKTATDKTYNLLASGFAYPKDMIIKFAQADDEFVRRMFRDLFSENRDLAERVTAFQASAEEIRAKYDDGNWKQHYQTTNAISTYLWLMFPNKYYIYKYELYKDVAKELESDYKPVRNGTTKTMLGGFAMYDEICAVVQQDAELADMLRSALTDDCYPDPELKIMTIDIGYYLSKFFLEEKKAAEDEAKWEPKDYDPDITVDEWIDMLNDSSVFTLNSLQIMKRMKDYGGQATCTQLANKYGESANYYNAGSFKLAQRVAEKTGCTVMTSEDGSNKWWPILYMGKDAEATDAGVFTWRLRGELAEALEKIDLSGVSLYAETKPTIWKISHGTESTGISDVHKKLFLERNVVVVHSGTKAKGVSKVSQGKLFTETIKNKDFFYLCYGNRIQLLGQFTTDEAVENPDLKNGWYERPYRLIMKTKNTTPYDGAKKWWTPNDNSMCIKINEKDFGLFEELILQPYFDMTVKTLFSGTKEPSHYWWLTMNPKRERFTDMKFDEEQSYSLYNENGNKRKIWQNYLDAKVGDIVIGYEAAPVKKIVAIAEITQANDGEKLYFVKKEGLAAPIDHSVLEQYPELEKMEFFLQPNGNLYKLTEDEYELIMDIVRKENPLVSESVAVMPYTKEDFLNMVYMNKERYDVLVALLRNKMNVILQGAPGVGKTFVAKKLAYAMMGETDDTRIELIQFHQNYSYEDFIMGYRPDGVGFKLSEGIFYRFCQKAANDPEKEYFFIIDEINRGNMSKIFGELLMLLEKEYRGTKATLAYSGMPFFVPQNVYIIGMMNTADRSLALIDYALRRRFSFFEMEPGFHSDGFRKYQDTIKNETFNNLIQQITILNKDIAEDQSLGCGFQIGHSYFCGRDASNCTADWMRSVVEFDILPMLSEYWFDEPQKLQRWEKNLRGVFDDE